MRDIVALTESTTCCKCGGRLGVGIYVRCEFDIETDGYVHRHRNGCHHRDRNIDHIIVMEAISVEQYPTPKAKARPAFEVEAQA